MKNLSRSRLLLVVVISIVMLLFSGLVVGGAIREAIRTLEKQRTELQAEYERRKKIDDSRSDYQAQTARFDKQYEEMTAAYPAAISQNNQILFLRGVEDEFHIRIPSASYTEPETLYRFQYLAPGNQSGYELIRSTIQFPMSLTYPEWKRFISYIEETKGRDVIETVSADYNENESLVDVSVTISQYAITGDDRKDDEMTTEVETGTDNIFSGANLKISTEPEPSNDYSDYSYVVKESGYETTGDGSNDGFYAENGEETVADGEAAALSEDGGEETTQTGENEAGDNLPQTGIRNNLR
ncbi:MAG: hypothetical protein K5696_08830 [Lachnospiraceae bacterium]|nr:hypothetical protein [Lachnospiraceae bacterium]